MASLLNEETGDSCEKNKERERGRSGRQGEKRMRERRNIL